MAEEICDPSYKDDYWRIKVFWKNWLGKYPLKPRSIRPGPVNSGKPSSQAASKKPRRLTIRGEQLGKTHPDLAARLWCAQGMRLLVAGKSKYYDAAVANFEHAKQCFEMAGLSSNWTLIVNRVQTVHRRKLGFMSQFEELVVGRGPITRPSFLERARAKWGHHSKGGTM